jgi:hypothetical protein
LEDNILSLKSPISIVLFALAYASPVFAQEAPSSRPRPQEPPPAVIEPVDAAFVPPVESKTEALEVLSATRKDSFLRIRIKNVSGKNIYSFRMSYHKNGQALLFSFIMSDTKTALLPGEVYKYEHPFYPNSPFAREPLTFEAVLLEDGTGDGDPDKVKSLQDLYLANRKELEHVTALLQAAIDAADIETAGNLQDLLVKVSEIPNYMYGVALSGLSGITLPSWKETTMQLLRDIERKRQEDVGVKIQAELTKIKERFSKTLTKYPGAI